MTYPSTAQPSPGQPRLAFVGLGWIGRMRLSTLAAAGCEVAALCDPDAEQLEQVHAHHPGAATFSDLGALLAAHDRLHLDGVVIATPNVLHVDQTVAALEAGLSVFCQKPLATTADGARQMITAARRADRLLAVDYTYRGLESARQLRRLVQSGEIGKPFHLEACFHNAYGPSKPWSYDRELAGGGAFLDLGVHLLDLVLWLLDAPQLEGVEARRYWLGLKLGAECSDVEDFAVVDLRLGGDVSVHLETSWRAHVGRDCLFRVALFGSEGGTELHNVDGSFYDFELEHHEGSSKTCLARDEQAELGATAVAWSRQLARSAAFDPSVELSLLNAAVVDRVYGEQPSSRLSPLPLAPSVVSSILG